MAFDELGRHDDAEAPLRHALSLSPHSHSNKVRLASVLHALGRNEEALVHVKEVVAKDSPDATTLAETARLLKSLGETERALKNARIARTKLMAELGTTPNDCELLDWLANVHGTLGEWDEAERRQRQTMTLQPTEYRALELADTLTERQRWNEARDAFR